MPPQAQPPRPPQPSRPLARAQAAWAVELRKRYALEHTSILRGLVLLAVLVLLLSGVRAGWSRMFVPHWWRQW